jgi:hypothetical protein
MAWYRAKIRQIWVVEVELRAESEEEARRMAMTPVHPVPEEAEYDRILDCEVEEIKRSELAR